MATKTEQRDHVDRFLETIHFVLPDLDLEVEGIVDRISGLSRRIHRTMDETLVEFGLDSAEHKALSALAQAGPPYRSTPGKLAKRMDLSSGAMTNRLDRLEQAGLIRRLPDAEDVAAVQSAYFNTVRETIERYGGRLEKFIGDAAMAVFGVPRTRDDDAERAVRAGLALTNAVDQLSVKVGL